MEIRNNAADDKVSTVLYEFNKIYKNAENSNYKQITRKYPFYFFNSELHNRYKTSFRMLKQRNNVNTDNYPKIGYFYRK